MINSHIRLIGTCPAMLTGESGASYRARVISVARWADNQGWDSILIYTYNQTVDPWLVAHTVVLNTERLRPLIAIQPIYMHPFTAANAAASIQAMYDRVVDFNMVAGDFSKDRDRLGDELAHDHRYDRLVEYGRVMRGLLSSSRPFSFSGKYYQVENLQLFTKRRGTGLSSFLISGSSDRSRSAALDLGACAIQYPMPSEHHINDATPDLTDLGVRIGLIGRDTREKAWTAARARFPPSPEGARVRQYASGISDSVWTKALTAAEEHPGEQMYWLGPFKNFQSACPYLVGSMEELAAEMKNFIALGFSTFLLDVPEDEDDARRISDIFRMATSVA